MCSKNPHVRLYRNTPKNGTRAEGVRKGSEIAHLHIAAALNITHEYTCINKLCILHLNYIDITHIYACIVYACTIQFITV